MVKYKYKEYHLLRRVEMLFLFMIVYVRQCRKYNKQKRGESTILYIEETLLF